MEAQTFLEQVNIGQDLPQTEFTETWSSDDQVLIQLGNVALLDSEANALFLEQVQPIKCIRRALDLTSEYFCRYFQRYHPLFPILDISITPSALHSDCPTLFWAIVTTASRSLRPGLYPALCDLMPGLISPHFIYQSYSARPCQVLLILCMFPVPVKQTRDDVRWIYSGMAIQMATLAGLHATGSDNEYRPAGAVSATGKDRQELTRTWYCCAYVNAMYGIH
jgi:hypothetical protein